jgi:hypothetical protein
MEREKTGTPYRISQSRISRIKVQGYDSGFTDEEISVHAVGNRFAFQLCTLLFTTGLILTNTTILTIAAVVAFLSVILPYHVFDYLYNYSVRHWFNRPKLPRRTAQAKFACGLAALWIAAIIYLFYSSLFVWGYVLGGVLFVVAILVSTLDICIPSMIYNTLFRRVE